MGLRKGEEHSGGSCGLQAANGGPNFSGGREDGGNRVQTGPSGEGGVAGEGRVDSGQMVGDGDTVTEMGKEGRHQELCVDMLSLRW